MLVKFIPDAGKYTQDETHIAEVFNIFACREAQNPEETTVLNYAERYTGEPMKLYVPLKLSDVEDVINQTKGNIVDLTPAVVERVRNNGDYKKPGFVVYANKY